MCGPANRRRGWQRGSGSIDSVGSVGQLAASLDPAPFTAAHPSPHCLPHLSRAAQALQCALVSAPHFLLAPCLPASPVPLGACVGDHRARRQCPRSRYRLASLPRSQPPLSPYRQPADDGSAPRHVLELHPLLGPGLHLLRVGGAACGPGRRRGGLGGHRRRRRLDGDRCAALRCREAHGRASGAAALPGLCCSWLLAWQAAHAHECTPARPCAQACGATRCAGPPASTLLPSCATCWPP